jgi:rod shape determining protein RodA
MSAPYSNQFKSYSSDSASLRGALFRIHIDVPLFMLILLTVIISVFIMYSATGRKVWETFQHALHIMVGLGVMWFIAILSPNTLKRWTPFLFILFLIPLILVLFSQSLGQKGGGAVRWLGVGGFRFQPSEVYKLMVPMMIAWLVAEARLPIGWGYYLAGLLVILLPVLLVAKQPDLGTALFIAMTGLITLFLAGLRWTAILATLLVLVLGAIFVWNTGLILKPYQKQRIENLLTEKKDVQGTHWQSEQSNIAIGSGGIYGKGYLSGTQSLLGFLPEAKTDFVFAVIAEEFGLFGALFVLMLYLLILFRGLVIATSAKDTFSRLLAGTISISLIINMTVNVLMVIGILPVVGLPLPPFSKGGTAIVFLLMSMGVLMSIQTHRKLM